MNLFGLYFSPAESVLLFLFLLVVLLCILILKKLSVLKTEEEVLPVRQAVPAVSAKGEVEGEIVAVLTAAVAMMMGKDAKDIRLSSVRRVQGKTGRSAWAQAGRMEQLIKYI